jgi:hypothetical protein
MASKAIPPSGNGGFTGLRFMSNALWCNHENGPPACTGLPPPSPPNTEALRNGGGPTRICKAGVNEKKAQQRHSQDDADGCRNGRQSHRYA